MLLLPVMSKLKPVASLALRLALGYAFLVAHGLPKLQSGDGSEWDWGVKFASSGYAPAALLYIAAYTEVLAGLAMILGLLTRWAALGLVAIMGYAIFKVHADDPYEKFELAIAYASAAVALLATGAGPLSLDRLIFGKRALE